MNIRHEKFLVAGSEARMMPADGFFIDDKQPKPMILFSHGFKGYKDWGAWNLMAETFAAQGFFFVKFNFSHNGGTTEDPIDFPDLDAFGNNTYSKELFDLQQMIDYVTDASFFPEQTNKKQLYLLGHSRGGGISILAAQDPRVKKLATLAAIADIGARFPKGPELEAWKKAGVIYIPNARTHQQMPLRYTVYQDYEAHKEWLNIGKAISTLDIPLCIIHAKDDPTVSLEDAMALDKKARQSHLILFEQGGHTFGMKHPWEASTLPEQLKKVLNELLLFMKN